MDVEQQLRKLVINTCKHKSGSVERQQGLTKIVRVIVKSGKLWKENSPHYEDALQKTWLYFCRNLCEPITGEQYDPDRSSIITWLNAYLRRRLQDSHTQEQANLVQTVSYQRVEADELINVVDSLEAPPDIPPILEITRQWALNDLDGELSRISIQGHPQVTCQVLILQRLPPETNWETLADKFGISISTLTSFYRRQCMPRLRQFGEAQGYLEGN